MGYSRSGFYLLHAFTLYHYDPVSMALSPLVLTYDDLQRLQDGFPPDTGYTYNAYLEFPFFDENIIFRILPNNQGMNASSNIYHTQNYILSSDLTSLNGLDCRVLINPHYNNFSYGRNANDVFLTISVSTDSRIKLIGNIESYEDGVFRIRVYPRMPFLLSSEELDNYLRTGKISDINLKIEMNLDIPSNTLHTDDQALITIFDDEVDAYINGEVASLVNPGGGGHFPEGLVEDYRCIAFLTDGTSLSSLGRIIILKLDDIPEHFQGYLLYNVLLTCRENGSMQGDMFIMEYCNSLPELIGQYTITLDSDRK